MAHLVHLLSLLFLSLTSGYFLSPPSRGTFLCPTALHGRAAAVRAATKGKTDAKKTKVYSTFGKKIIMAVKNGGSDSPDANKMLRDVITAAKRNNVPVDNIKRAIKRATETKQGDYAESIFEAYALGGASVIIHVLSDNANRANSDVSNIVNKRKFKMAESGSVLFMYDKFGLLSLEGKVDEEQLMDIAIEAGVDDIIVEEGIESADGGATTDVFTDASSIAALRDGVMSAFSIDDPLEIKLVYKSKAPVEVSDEEFEMNMAAIDALEDLDDVSHVEHNMSN